VFEDFTLLTKASALTGILWTKMRRNVEETKGGNELPLLIWRNLQERLFIDANERAAHLRIGAWDLDDPAP
jgi:hypothetical protein